MATNPSPLLPGYKPKACANCTLDYTPRRHDQLFCSAACKQEAQNRELLRGKQAYRALYHWTGARGADGGELMTELRRMAGEWKAEDRERGSPKPPLPERVRVKRHNAKML